MDINAEGDMEIPVSYDALGVDSSHAGKFSGSGVDKPWVEKYRPLDLNGIHSQEETISVLKRTLELSRTNLPHLLFYGPPGTGKTSTALALCKEMFGDRLMSTRVLELNASDERGIDVIRERVKGFAQLRAGVSDGSNGSAVPPFKIIILDEADTLTSEAQGALRRVMEIYSKSTRFCIICNYISRISAPLTSRCAKFRFRPLKSWHIESFLGDISTRESLHCPDKAIKRIVELSEGDLRRAIMLLQSASWIKSKEGIGPETVDEIAGVIPDKRIEGLMEVVAIQDVGMIQEKVKGLMSMGYSGAQILSQVNAKMVYDVHLDLKKKLCLSKQLAKCDRALTDGASEYLQVLGALVICQAS